MRSWLVVVGALLVSGCGKQDSSSASASATPSAPTSTKVQDALWALAPENTGLAVVVSGRGLTALDAAWREVDKVITATPQLARLAADFKEEMTKAFGPNGFSFGAAGMSPARGAALFMIDEGNLVMLLPVDDRDKFVAVAKGTRGKDVDTFPDKITCKPIAGYYACAEPPALLDRVGKSQQKPNFALAGARGEIELLIRDRSPTRNPIAAAVQISRGQFVARGAMQIAGADVSVLKAGGKPSADLAKSAGFAVLNHAPVFSKYAEPPPDEIVPGVDAATLIKSIAGPIDVSIPAGTVTVEVKVPLADPAPAKKLVEQCDQLPMADMIGATVVQGRCKVVVPMLALDAEAWVEGNVLRVRKNGPAASTTLAPSAIAKELATGDWAFALYGRGTLLGEGELPKVQSDATEVRLGIRMLSLLTEGGFGIRAHPDGTSISFVVAGRTIWANPDDVAAKILAVGPAHIIDRSAAVTGKQIAASAPASPFATDFKAGPGGALVPLLAFAGLVQLAIPVVEMQLAPAIAPPGTDSDSLLPLMTLKDAMCECKDAACAKAVLDKVNAWSIQQAEKDWKPSDVELKMADAINSELSACMQTAMGTAGSGSAAGSATE